MYMSVCNVLSLSLLRLSDCTDQSSLRKIISRYRIDHHLIMFFIIDEINSTHSRENIIKLMLSQRDDWLIVIACFSAVIRELNLHLCSCHIYIQGIIKRRRKRNMSFKRTFRHLYLFFEREREREELPFSIYLQIYLVIHESQIQKR